MERRDDVTAITSKWLYIRANKNIHSVKKNFTTKIRVVANDQKQALIVYILTFKSTSCKK